MELECKNFEQIFFKFTTEVKNKKDKNIYIDDIDIQSNYVRFIYHDDDYNEDIYFFKL